jgi:hypothetical protein
VFGTTVNACRIPIHPNVFKIVAPCGDYYEDIPMKMYYGFRYLSYINFDFIIKLDENINIRNTTRFIDTVYTEATENDYIALNSNSNMNLTGGRRLKTRKNRRKGRKNRRNSRAKKYF